MKTNNDFNVPLFRPNQFPAAEFLPAGSSPFPLSEKAFYLMVLAFLLRRSIGPKAVKELLVPGKYVGFGK
jgi:hypothetical protein